MTQWLLQRRYALAITLTIYFTIHIVTRTLISPALGFDESEQAYLTQSLQWGYNSQPPLYTWMQSCVFGVFGCSAFSLALLKNLFLLATFLFMYQAIQAATDDKRIALISSLGMLLIPQIAWESHRDLSHTVAATCATGMLLYCIVQLADSKNEDRRRWQLFWYVMIGVAVGLGTMFKYNFVIVAIGFVGSSLTIGPLRRRILDRRLLLTAIVSVLILLPHAWWMLNHLDLASSKTITTLTTNESASWIRNVSTGMLALAGSTIGSCSLLVVLIVANYLWRRKQSTSLDPSSQCATESAPPTYDMGLLLERFLIIVAVILMMLVLSGHALEFKNRWLQPFLCVVPAWLVTRYRDVFAIRLQDTKMVTRAALTVMAVVLSATVIRPIVRPIQGRPGHLNTPYAKTIVQIRAQTKDEPDLILAQDMRIAGNLRVEFPNARIVSCDAPTVLPIDVSDQNFNRILVLNGGNPDDTPARLPPFAKGLLDEHPVLIDWQCVSAPYLYGQANQIKHFQFQWRSSRPTIASQRQQPAGRTAVAPESTYKR